MSDSKPRSQGPLFPVVTLVLSVVGLMVPPLSVLVLGLGLYGYLRARKDPAWAPRKNVAAMSLAVSAAGLVVFAAILVPRAKLFHLRTRQQQCRVSLQDLARQQAALYEREKRYTTRLSELDLSAVRQPFVVRLASEGPLWTKDLLEPDAVGAGLDDMTAVTASTQQVDAALPQLVRTELGVHGTCPACSVTMACAAQLDEDPAVDVWTVSSQERTGPSGEKIPAGLAWNEVDDLRQ